MKNVLTAVGILLFRNMVPASYFLRSHEEKPETAGNSLMPVSDTKENLRLERSRGDPWVEYRGDFRLVRARLQFGV
jgi:hypothetical protein